ncbi:MAG: hypothetical protein A2V89_01030 [Gammaproteobacteria bacterium RBG_16_37_9]|nr:MAG: hypothetical protein A2V89_01030 [Gammaproteobacteria bacterium RBG_16_37_9]
MIINSIKTISLGEAETGISAAQSSCKYEPGGTLQKNQVANTDKAIDSKQKCVESSGVSYLKIEVIQKMLNRFLVEKQMPKEELASALGITVKSLEQLFSQEDNSNLIRKINLPLVKLYCETWARS